MSDRALVRGFTVLELAVALAVGGLALVGATTMLGAVTDQRDGIVAATRVTDEAANGERLLRTLAASFQPSLGGEVTFVGERHAARFASWCRTTNGWQERCWVGLSLHRADRSADPSAPDSFRLLAQLSTGGTEVVLADLPDAELRYLDDAANGGRWFHTWGAGVSAPLAIGVVTSRDTLIVRVGIGR
jgi:prepilin-type N-terminal cleavage/methylation domain-containing protein